MSRKHASNISIHALTGPNSGRYFVISQYEYSFRIMKWRNMDPDPDQGQGMDPDQGQGMDPDPDQGQDMDPDQGQGMPTN